MVLDAVSNFVRGTTDAAVGTSDTTVSVADASIFPDPETDGEFNVVIWDVNNFPRPDQDGDVEILRVTGRDTTADELTVTRGQEMTSAAAHPEGSAIHLSPTAKMFSDIESTFGDFWDAGAQELTADVNNTNTTTEALKSESVNTDELSFTQPNYDLLNLEEDIDIPDDTVTDITGLQFENQNIGTLSDDSWSPDSEGYYRFDVALAVDGIDGSSGEVRCQFDTDGDFLTFFNGNQFDEWTGATRTVARFVYVVYMTDNDDVSISIRHKTGVTESLWSQEEATSILISKEG